jgi:protein-S-isoprenylcysteine O-methyltransferase Ste14
MSRQREWRWNNVPVPEAHVGLLAAGALMTVVRRRPITSRAAVRRVGWPLIMAGVALGTWAVRTAGQTDLEHPNRLVTGGPYARSRHPMYVAWTLVYLGAALVANTKWPLMLMPLLAAITHREALREEARLLDAFGPDYEEYQARVRRYI